MPFQAYLNLSSLIHLRAKGDGESGSRWEPPVSCKATTSGKVVIISLEQYKINLLRWDGKPDSTEKKKKKGNGIEFNVSLFQNFPKYLHCNFQGSRNESITHHVRHNFWHEGHSTSLLWEPLQICIITSSQKKSQTNPTECLSTEPTVHKKLSRSWKTKSLKDCHKQEGIEETCY